MTVTILGCENWHVFLVPDVYKGGGGVHWILFPPPPPPLPPLPRLSYILCTKELYLRPGTTISQTLAQLYLRPWHNYISDLAQLYLRPGTTISQTDMAQLYLRLGPGTTISQTWHNYVYLRPVFPLELYSIRDQVFCHGTDLSSDDCQ